MELKECRELADRLIAQHGLAQFGWHFNFDNAKKRGGLCSHRFRRISMSRFLVPMWTREQVEQTLLHEIAHALVGGGAGHSNIWLLKARAIGYTGGRCHENETAPPRYDVVCPKCGKIGTRHRAPGKGKKMLHVSCRSAVEFVDTLVSV